MGPQVVQGVQPASGSSQLGWLSASEISGQSVPMSTQLQPSTATTTAPATVVTATAVSAPQPLSTLPLVPLTPMSHLPTMEGVDKIDPSEVFQLLQDQQAIRSLLWRRFPTLRKSGFMRTWLSSPVSTPAIERHSAPTSTESNQIFSTIPLKGLAC